MDYYCKRFIRLRKFFKLFFTSIYLLILSLDAAHTFHPPVDLRPTIYEPSYRSNYHPNRNFNTPILSLCNKNDLISRIIRSSNNPCKRRNQDDYLFKKTKKIRDRSTAGLDDSFAMYNNNNKRRISKRSAGQSDDVEVKTLDDLFKNFNSQTFAPINRRTFPRKTSRKRKKGRRKKHHTSKTQHEDEAPFFTSKEGDMLTIAGLDSPVNKETAKYSLLVHHQSGKYLEITKQHSIRLTRKLNVNCYLVVKTDDFGTVRLQGDSTEDFLAMHENGSLYATRNYSDSNTIFKHVYNKYDQYISKNYGVYLYMRKSGKPPKRPVKKSRKGTKFMELKRNEIEIGREKHNSVPTTNHIQDNEEAFFPTTAKMTSLAPNRGRKGRKNNKHGRRILQKRRRERMNRNNKKKSKSRPRSTRDTNSLLGFEVYIKETNTVNHAEPKRSEHVGQVEIILKKPNTFEVVTSDSSTHARDDT